ncbi:tetraspanin [Holotrichia oblita]|uniref:Tetraspanin n=1 Tax=Holotrichia oblita TaxID=644536 RepID=A0ACB9SRR5_HOLOL|nr:tetraspanin [Holotrichia oblita]
MDARRPYVLRFDGARHEQLLDIGLHAPSRRCPAGNRSVLGNVRISQRKPVLTDFGTSFFRHIKSPYNCAQFKFQFAALLFVILVAEIAATVWAYIYADDLEPLVRGYVKSTVQEEYWHDSDRQHTFDTIQRELKCCGSESPRDWIEDRDVKLSISSSTPDNYLIPASCCRHENVAPALCDATRKQLVAGAIDYTVIYDTGCVTKVANYIRDNLCVVLGIGLGIIVVQTLGLIFSLILTYAIGKNRRYKA